MYDRLIRAAMQTPWAITDEYADIIRGILVERASGIRLSKDEIQARINGADEDHRPPPPRTSGQVAIIPIYGVLAHRQFQASSGMMSADLIQAMIKRVDADDEIGTVLFDCSTPGGTVEGIPETAGMIAALSQRKRTVAIANGQLCSAGYWLASQCREIVAIPSATSIGNIGVYTIHEDISKALEQKGIVVTVISAGKRKTDGHPFAPLSAETKATIQKKVDATYALFVKDVAKGRGVTPADVRNGFGEGLSLNAADAKAVGLIDRIATFDDTLARLTGAKRSSVSAGQRAEEGDRLTLAEEIADPVVTEQPDGVTAGDVVIPGKPGHRIRITSTSPLAYEYVPITHGDSASAITAALSD